MLLSLFRILKMVIYIKIYEEIPIFLLFSVQNSYFSPIFWDCEFLFSYFLDPSCYLTPCISCNLNLIQFQMKIIQAISSTLVHICGQTDSYNRLCNTLNV